MLRTIAGFGRIGEENAFAVLARGNAVPPILLVLTRVWDVAVGCGIAFVATRLASLGNRPPTAQPSAA